MTNKDYLIVIVYFFIKTDPFPILYSESYPSKCHFVFIIEPFIRQDFMLSLEVFCNPVGSLTIQTSLSNSYFLIL